jgi:hypothetical protein
MITLRRLHIESTSSPEELRTRVEASIGRTLLAMFDTTWSGDIQTPFVGKITGATFTARRRARNQYARVHGTIEGNTIDAEIGLPSHALITFPLGLAFGLVIFWPFAILITVVTAFLIRYDVNEIEKLLRDIAAVGR